MNPEITDVQMEAIFGGLQPARKKVPDLVRMGYTPAEPEERKIRGVHASVMAHYRFVHALYGTYALVVNHRTSILRDIVRPAYADGMLPYALYDIFKDGLLEESREVASMVKKKVSKILRRFHANRSAR